MSETLPKVKRSRFGQLVWEKTAQQGMGSPTFARIILYAPGYANVARVVLDWWRREDVSRLIERHKESFIETRQEGRRPFTPEISEGMIRTLEIMWRAVNLDEMSVSPEDVWALAIFHDLRKKSPDSWRGDSTLLWLQVQNYIASEIGDIKFWNLNARALPQLTWPNGQFLEASPPKTEDELASAIVAIRRAIESEYLMVEIFHSAQQAEAKHTSARV